MSPLSLVSSQATLQDQNNPGYLNLFDPVHMNSASFDFPDTMATASATWYDLPLEVHNIILEYILPNRTISKTCPLLSCLVCFAPDRQSDFLSLRLVSRNFVNLAEAMKMLLSSAKLSIHHAAHLKSIATSDFPYQRIRHLELPQDCIPIRSKIAFSMKSLKTTLPGLRSITIHTSYRLHYGMCAHEPLYTHAYGALRIAKAVKGHFGLAQYTMWPEPSRDELIAARNRPKLTFKPSDLHTNPRFNPLRVSDPRAAVSASTTAGQNILAASLDYYATTGPHFKVNPYLTAWHARLIHDAHLDPSKTVRVIIHAPLELIEHPRAHAAGVYYIVRNTTIDSTDMMLRFALNATEVEIPQVLNQSWFDSRFWNSPVARWDRAVRRQPKTALRRSYSVHNFGERERNQQMGIWNERGHLITAKKRTKSNDY